MGDGTEEFFTPEAISFRSTKPHKIRTQVPDQEIRQLQILETTELLASSFPA